MNSSRALLYSALLVGFFIIGFITSLAIHWSIRPSVSSEVTLQAEDTSDSLDFAALQSDSERLKTEVAILEAELARAETKHDVDEGHTRALIHELQTYRDERNALFADLERRKQLLRDKLDELDEKILAQLELRDNAPQPTDYEIANNMMGLLSYPHALNDLAALNSAFLDHPKQHRELVDQRFELMVQQEDYNRTNAVYDVLLPRVEKLNKQHQNNTTIQAVFCSADFCEIQTRMQTPELYFDYWQQWLTEVRSADLTKLVEHQFGYREGNELVGTVIIHLL